MTYQGATLCIQCKGLIRPAQPGHESEPASHGLGPCCWAAYRAGLGLPAKPFPQVAR